MLERDNYKIGRQNVLPPNTILVSFNFTCLFHVAYIVFLSRFFWLDQLPQPLLQFFFVKVHDGLHCPHRHVLDCQRTSPDVDFQFLLDGHDSWIMWNDHLYEVDVVDLVESKRIAHDVGHSEPAQEHHFHKELVKFKLE